jgi:hypothetical protein
MTGLNPSSIVNVTYTFNSATALANNTSTLLILGSTNPQMAGLYTSAASVASAYGATAPETLAAQAFFSYSPQPQSVQTGNWYYAAGAGYLLGGILTPAQQAMANFNAITNGGANIAINGTNVTLTGLNFASATNLNGVASILTSALSSGTVTWNGSNFVVTSNTTGAGVVASGTATFSAIPAANDTITINGQVLTFVSTVTIPATQVLIGATAAATAQNLLTLLNSSSIAALTALRYSVNGAVLTVSYPTVGTAGNSIAIAKSSTAITLSGATLAGGVVASTVGYATSPTASYQDISSLFGLTVALAQIPVAGVSAESAVNAVIRNDTNGPYFFALTIASPNVQDSDHQAIAAYIEATSHVYFVSTQETTSLVAGNGIGATLAAAGYKRTCVNYNGTSPYMGAAVAAVPLTVNYDQAGSANTVMFKSLPGITADNLTANQAAALIANRVNFSANYSNGVAFLQNGVMSGPAYIDEIVGITSIIFDLQTAEFNLLLTQPKVDQTDAGMQTITAVDEAVLDNYVAANFLAPGVWTGSAFGTLTTGQTLPKGYYCYRAPIATQSVANRALRQAIPGQHALKLAGAVQSSSVLLNVNR